MSIDMPKTDAEAARAAFWADIAARARTNSTPANTEFEAHYLNERHDRARKVERTWRGEITPERIADDWDEALALNVERCTTCKGYGAVQCPPCAGEGCWECEGTTEVYCVACGGYGSPLTAADLAAIARVDARPENAGLLAAYASQIKAGE